MPSNEARAFAPDEVLEFTRVFEAPRALLFRLWAEPEHRLRWWGPEGYGLSHCEVDFRVGGAWSIAMKRVDGYEHWVRGTFEAIREPSHVTFTYVNDADQHETRVVIDFVDLGAKTEMRFRQAPFLTVVDRDDHGGGWRSSLGLLEAYARTVNRADPKPVGLPRIEGNPPDIVAARARMNNENGER
jgi:uncharacterized protein YndB with AHSA1/START domain